MGVDDKQERYARGGAIHGFLAKANAGPAEGIILSPGGEITDPDEAERLGLTVHARWLRCHGKATPGPDGCSCRTDHAS